MVNIDPLVDLNKKALAVSDKVHEQLRKNRVEQKKLDGKDAKQDARVAADKNNDQSRKAENQLAQKIMTPEEQQKFKALEALQRKILFG